MRRLGSSLSACSLVAALAGPAAPGETTRAVARPVKPSSRKQEPPQGAASCRSIRRLPHPLRKRSDLPAELKYSLITCAGGAGEEHARPLITMTVEGGRRLVPFEVVKVFESRREAVEYAARNGIAEVEPPGEDEALAVPQALPVVRLLRAIKTSDPGLLETVLSWRMRREFRRGESFSWGRVLETYKRSFAEFAKKFGGDAFAEVEFAFRGDGEAGRLDIFLKGRGKIGEARVVNEGGEWKMDER